LQVEDELLGCLNGTLNDPDYRKAWEKFENEVCCFEIYGILGAICVVLVPKEHVQPTKSKIIGKSNYF
jgi:hypothetical protein